jgi:hypothetical protein
MPQIEFEIDSITDKLNVTHIDSLTHFFPKIDYKKILDFLVEMQKGSPTGLLIAGVSGTVSIYKIRNRKRYLISNKTERYWRKFPL